MEENYATVEQLNNEKLTESDFYTDVIRGLKSGFKYFSSKYFYDENGDKLFQDIMNCPEYYPTSCEMEIFSNQSAEIGDLIMAKGDEFDLIELGAGDATKSIHLLRYLMAKNAAFTYFPIDISGNIISYLTMSLPVTLPGVNIKGLHGEYFEMLKKADDMSSKRKVVLFLGSNIGNMKVHEAEVFCVELRQYLHTGDMVLIGADLKKDPKIILAAYNDAEGLTKKFNLNLLTRINRELGGNFDLSGFDHYPTYNPQTGACESFLVSLVNQKVRIGNEIICFEKDECIHMEVSQKFHPGDLTQLAALSGFRPVKNFFDHKKWFADSIWLAD